MKNKVIYNKLIRDKIPEIIENSGKKSQIYTADTEEYKKLLLKKLVEEAIEMQETPCTDELADILEVIEAIKEAYYFNNELIAKRKEEKKVTRGAFKKQIVLEYVYED